MPFIGYGSNSLAVPVETSRAVGRTHGFTFVIRPELPSVNGAAQPQAPAQPPAPFNASTASFFLHNGGRAIANNLEVTFNWQPNNYQIWPVRSYNTDVAPDGRFTLRFATMSPHENIQIEILTVGNAPELLNVRCDECIGKYIALRPTRILPSWMLATLWGLVFLGLAAVIYIFLLIFRV